MEGTGEKPGLVPRMTEALFAAALAQPATVQEGDGLGGIRAGQGFGIVFARTFCKALQSLVRGLCLLPLRPCLEFLFTAQ